MSSRARGRAVPRSGEGGAGAAGRAGARSRAPEAPSRPPHDSTMRDLGRDPPPTEGQFEDVEDRDKAAAAASLIKGDARNIEQPHPPASPRRDIDDSDTSSSINPISPELSPPPNTKLNPSAPEFSPSKPHTSTLSPSTTGMTTNLNPSTPEFSLANGSNHDSKVISSSSSSSTGKRITLDPRSSEFVPKTGPISTLLNSSLNAAAPAFVPNDPLPTGMQNGTLPDEDADGIQSVVLTDEEEAEALQLTPKDLLGGVHFPVTQTREEDKFVLNVTADVLSKAAIYPGSFERGQTKIENMVKSWIPNSETLLNLAELLVHWGIMEPSLRLTVSKICQSLCEMEVVRVDFMHLLLARLKVWYDKKTELEKEKLIELSFFYAEIFSRIRYIHIEDTKEEVPVKILGDAVTNLVEHILSNFHHERFIISACHILKLTGPLLASLPDEAKMSSLMAILRGLKTNSSPPLSQKCLQIVTSLLDLHARGWGESSRPPPTSSVPPLSGGEFYDVGMGGAAEDPFVTFGGLPNETVFQVPVSNPDEWSEFLDDDNQLIEDSDQHTTESFMIEKIGGGGGGGGGAGGGGGEEEEALDAEIEKEFEFFVQDLEEHLLNMGEMDPEQLQEQEQQKQGDDGADAD